MSTIAKKVSAYLENEGHRYDLSNSLSIKVLALDLQDMLAAAGFGPVQAARAEAWDEGFGSGWDEAKDPGAFVNDSWNATTPNPYRKAS